MKTTYPKKEEVDRKYLLIDAEGAILGRLAVQIADHLRGKNKPIFHPAVDTGDFVVVINADKIRLTGNKLEQKVWYRHSLYPGGLKTIPYKVLMVKQPDVALRKAVQGMLPHNKLARLQIRKLKIYSGTEHPHEAQKPEKVSLK
jgi:large subunit ribosomal protein L13